MRSVFLGATLFVLAGCATVSMVPGEATVETNITQSQTALRAASEDFLILAEESGWVSASTGLSSITSILMNGRSDEDEAASEYSDLIEADTARLDAVIARIALDASTARVGLANVTREARLVLDDTDHETSRTDVTSFERALVRAQRANRAFSSARETVAQRTQALDAVDRALDSFAVEIDTARRVADALAARYASIGDAAI